MALPACTALRSPALQCPCPATVPQLRPRSAENTCAAAVVLAAAAAARVLSVPLEEIVTPGLSMRVAGEGMPLPSGEGKVRRHLQKR